MFDFISYNDLKKLIFLIKNLTTLNLYFTEDDKYILKGVITAPGGNHFTNYINKLIISNLPNKLELNKNYYYDDLEFEGNFIEIENLELL